MLPYTYAFLARPSHQISLQRSLLLEPPSRALHPQEQRFRADCKTNSHSPSGSWCSGAQASGPVLTTQPAAVQQQLFILRCPKHKTNSHFCWPCFYLFLVLNRGANDTSSIPKNQKVKQIFRRARCYMLYLT